MGRRLEVPLIVGNLSYETPQMPGCGEWNASARYDDAGDLM